MGCFISRDGTKVSFHILTLHTLLKLLFYNISIVQSLLASVKKCFKKSIETLEILMNLKMVMMRTILHFRHFLEETREWFMIFSVVGLFLW